MNSAYEAARLELARIHIRPGESFRDVFRELAVIVSAALSVERVGVWLLIDERRALRCFHLFQRSSHEVYEGAVLQAQDFPTYFRMLTERRAIAANDAQIDEVTRELRDAYLDPLGIRSLLDAPIYRKGQVVGVICHEHVGPARLWNPGERDFVASVAESVARLFEEAARQKAEGWLSGYENYLLELRRMEAVGRMVAGVAHDFRSILGAVTGYADLLLNGDHLAEPAKGHATKIRDAAERGRALTEQITRFSRNEHTAPRVLDARRAIESFAELMRMMVGSGVQLKLNFPAAVSRVLIDPAQLERAVMNLVINARDASAAGGTITLGLSEALIAEGMSASFVVIEVIDNGVGMDADTRERMFEPFFTTKGAQGSGLGLSIVYQIVSRAGGFIRVYSQPGQGTTLRMYLPRIAPAD